MNDNAKRLLEDIRQCSKRARDAEQAWMDARQHTAALKKEWETTVAELQRCIDDADSGQMRLPLDDGHDDPSPKDDKWKSVPMADIGIPKRIVTLLKRAGLATIGEFDEWMYLADRKEIKGFTSDMQTAAFAKCRPYITGEVAGWR